MRIIDPKFTKLFLDIMSNNIKPANESDGPKLYKTVKDALNTPDMACDMLLLMSEVIGDD